MRDVPIPGRMAKLPRDRRGYPIPHTVYRDDEGRPHFTINDEMVRQTVIKENRCPICGTKLHRFLTFVGGPLSAFHPHGSYIDPAMHRECATYALQVCPWLAAPNYAKRIDDRTLRPDDAKTLLLTDPTSIPTRPPVFVLVIATGQIFSEDIFGIVTHVKPVRPYRAVEYWRQGTRLSAGEGEMIVEEHMAGS